MKSKVRSMPIKDDDLGGRARIHFGVRRLSNHRLNFENFDKADGALSKKSKLRKEEQCLLGDSNYLGALYIGDFRPTECMTSISIDLMQPSVAPRLFLRDERVVKRIHKCERLTFMGFNISRSTFWAIINKKVCPVALNQFPTQVPHIGLRWS